MGTQGTSLNQGSEPPENKKADPGGVTPQNREQKEHSKAEFMGIPLTGWAVFSVSFIVVLYTAGHFGFKLYDEADKLRADKAAAEVKAKKASAVNDDTSAYTNAVTKEMEFHKKDRSGHHVTIHKDKKGEVFATFFDSDGCVAIGRPGSPTPYQPYPKRSSNGR
jgi:hypothetical protein